MEATCWFVSKKYLARFIAQTVCIVCYFSGQCMIDNSNKLCTSEYTTNINVKYVVGNVWLWFKSAYCLPRKQVWNNVTEALLNNFVNKQYSYSYMLWWLGNQTTACTVCHVMVAIKWNSTYFVHYDSSNIFLSVCSFHLLASIWCFCPRAFFKGTDRPIATIGLFDIRFTY